MALLVGASASLAATCADDPNECTLKKLCEVATTVDGGNTIWSTASGAATHVTLAQSLGMDCSVTPIVDLCDNDPSECKVSQICGKATTVIAGQMSWDSSAVAYVAMAKEYGLQCDVSEEATFEKITTNLKLAFISESKLYRQQLQYALKKLGYYAYGADGLWGKGTSSAFDKFVLANDLQNNTEGQVFRILLSKVTVPSSFAVTPKKVDETLLTQANRNGLFPEYACTINKFDMKMQADQYMPGYRVTTNEGMTAVTFIMHGQRKKLDRKETKEAIKEYNLDQTYSLKFSDNKVVLGDPNLNAQKISEALKDENPADRAKLTRIMENFFAPITYIIHNNVASWSQRYPKEFEIGNATIAHSFNLKTQQYSASTRTTVPIQAKFKIWASCDPS